MLGVLFVSNPDHMVSLQAVCFYLKYDFYMCFVMFLNTFKNELYSQKEKCDSFPISVRVSVPLSPNRNEFQLRTKETINGVWRQLRVALLLSDICCIG